ncbi:MAG: molybdopterin molybdotransferase MoeA [Candidatus Hydrogenedentes bacterium]|nr:molybdopterin molybdotransferase MoeA [Candidatus Hydrogenedentota bacterium]
MRTLIDPDNALALVLHHSAPMGPRRNSVHAAVGWTVAEDIAADADYPPFDRSMMDGYCVCVADAGERVRVAGEVAAGGTVAGVLVAGTAIEIMTGAPCPAGTEAVVPKEDVTREGDAVTLPREITIGQNITRRGTECAKGATVLRVGDTITPLALASIVTFGIESVLAYSTPRLAIITTGDELVPPNETPGPSQIRNSNGPMLTAMAQALGVSPTLVIHAKDTMDELRTALARAADTDFIVLTGAVSAGKYDSVPDALCEFGATPVFHKVTQRPGKPIFFATRDKQLIFGLPGNPLSCHLGFHRYVAPALRKFMHCDPVPPRIEGVLAASFTVKGPRTLFQLARAEHRDAAWRVTPLVGRGSADMYAAATANALLRFEPGVGSVEAGTRIEFEWLLGAH